MSRPGNKQPQTAVIGLLILLCAFARAQDPWATSGNDIYNTNSGNVGIGTSSPAQLLELYKNNADVAIRFHDPGDQHYTMGMDYSDGRKFKIARGSDFSDVKLTITPAGNVGIGTTSPRQELDVIGNILVNNASGTLGGGGLYLGDGFEYWNWRPGTSAEGRDLFLDVYYDGSYSNVLAIDRASGRVSIGTTTFASGYLLAVDGKIICEEVKVKDSGSWPDHVFQADYNLMPLPEVERYIAEHKHLPDMPSAEEVAADGQSLGETQAKLLQKVEELTLYVIDLKKENEALKTRMADLEQ